jgi:hypothetical protein
MLANLQVRFALIAAELVDRRERRDVPIPAIVCRTSGDGTRATDTKGFDQQPSPR